MAVETKFRNLSAPDSKEIQNRARAISLGTVGVDTDAIVKGAVELDLILKDHQDHRQVRPPAI